MKSFKIFVIITLQVFNYFNVFASDAQQAFREATNAYQQGNYSAAIERYEAILKTSVFSKELFYNLGNCYYRTNQTGRAILNYERALRLSPTDRDVKHNIQLTQSRIVDNIEPLTEVFIFRWMKILRGGLSSGVWSVLTLLSLWTGIAGFIIWLMGKERVWKKGGFIAGLVGIPLSILLFFITESAASSFAANRFGIVTVKEALFKSSPDVQAPAVLTLHEGVKVEILDRVLNQVKIRLPNSEEGWLEENSLEKI